MNERTIVPYATDVVVRGRWTEDDAQIARLAVPAFFALVAEPMFLLADTAIVGHLGTPELAGLAIAGTVLQTVVGLSVFLAYGTTASVARYLGAGDLPGALRTGLSGVWLALVLGTLAGLLCAGAAATIIGWFGTGAAIDVHAESYLRVSAAGIPAMLVVLATTGILRGLQDTRTPLLVAVVANLVNIFLNLALVYGADMGVAGSAIGTVIAQWGSALALGAVVVRAAVRESSSLRPDVREILDAARTGVPLIVRTLTLRAALVLATVVAAGMSSASVAAHQIALTVATTLAFALDAIAIAGQALTGHYLGADDVDGARRATARMVTWGWRCGWLAAAALALLSPWLAQAFSGDEEVHAASVGVLLVVAAVQPVSGIVFVLDGVLIGAGDGRYLAYAGLVTLVAYVPLALLVHALSAGLVWLWAAYAAFMLARMVTLMLRERGDAWLVTGVRRAAGAEG
jgi:putative MATE family efflux protein